MSSLTMMAIVVTTMDYHLQPLTYHNHAAVHEVGHKVYHDGACK
jgi:hypothetical protein